MNKHPSGYYPGQPPPPPGAGGQPYDAYSTWSAAAAAAQQQYYQASAAAAAVPPAPAVNPYANYGYGPNVSWAHQPHHPPHRPPVPPPVVAPPPPPPAYGPYQPQSQHQPYQPQSQAAPPSIYPPRPLPPQNAPGQPPAGPRQFQQPPLKRQRVQSLPPGAQPRFPPLPHPPARASDTAATPLAGPQQPSFNRGNRTGGPSGGGNAAGRGRGNAMRPMRGGRGPGMNNRHANNGSRSSSSSAPRGPRRGTFSSGSSGGRVPRFEAPQAHNGWGNGPVTSTPTPSTLPPQDREGKRTLTDFRIVGFGFVGDNIVWSWGATRPVDDAILFSSSSNSEGPVAFPSQESPVLTKQEDDSDQVANGKEKTKKGLKENARIRIYFHPAGPLGARATGAIMPPPNGVPSRSAKRKKSESEEDDGERGNAKRHHGDYDEGPRSGSMMAEMLTPPMNGKKAQLENDSPAEPESSPIMASAFARDAEQSSEVSNEADWLGDALKEEGEEGELEIVDEENDDVKGDGLEVEEENEAAEYFDEIDEEEGEAASLFGSGVHPSPPTADNGSGDLIVQAVLSPTPGGADSENALMQDTNPNGVENQIDNTNESKSSRDRTLHPPFGGQSSGAGGPGGAGNKLSVSFAASSRRLVLEVEVIKYLKVFRAEGRIEFAASLDLVSPPDSADDDDAKPVIKGVCVRPFLLSLDNCSEACVTLCFLYAISMMEMWNESTGTFESVAIPSANSDASSNPDNALPPLYGATTVTFHVFLDLENPLSVPRWVKTGDVDDWLQTMFGVSATIKNGTNGAVVKREGASENRGWEGKITVVDPDPAPTLQNILENWATNSMVSQQKDREQFLKSCFYQSDGSEERKEHNMDNVVEILLRLIRGDRLLIGSNPGDFHHHHHHHHYHHNSANNSVHPTLQAAVGSDPSLLINQTHSSLAVLAMFRVLQQTATKYGGEEAKKDVEGKVKEIIKCLPQHMINKSLDGMFQKWSTPATQGTSKAGGSSAPAKVHR